MITGMPSQKARLRAFVHLQLTGARVKLTSGRDARLRIRKKSARSLVNIPDHPFWIKRAAMVAFLSPLPSEQNARSYFCCVARDSARRSGGREENSM